ncbi:hypothetical protein [Branchiibius sp. NY16-3462-2]|uniref:hypothetical protein n=1 Tax=Branchiibius sp. NY16-3462-2 TaxID=1807500 RepID=UPI00079CBC1C|nr:hypothetical protein [Branchiibius sp. NY16-3462-2]KYH45788.1 hypothetical protein AZH51_08845 [Branchiibius sp. NY16-3462-2]
MNDAAAAEQPLSTDAAKDSRITAVALLVVGLLGTFLTLWGWTGIRKNAVTWWEEYTTAGMSPWITFVVGLVLVLLSAIADAVLGRRSDVFQVAEGVEPTPLQTLANRLASWILVLITALGILLIWLRYR